MTPPDSGLAVSCLCSLREVAGPARSLCLHCRAAVVRLVVSTVMRLNRTQTARPRPRRHSRFACGPEPSTVCRTCLLPAFHRVSWLLFSGAGAGLRLHLQRVLGEADTPPLPSCFPAWLCFQGPRMGAVTSRRPGRGGAGYNLMRSQPLRAVFAQRECAHFAQHNARLKRQLEGCACPSRVALSVAQSVSDSLLTHGLSPARLLCPRGIPRQEYCRPGLLFPFQGIFPTQGWNPHPGIDSRFFTTEHQGSTLKME